MTYLSRDLVEQGVAGLIGTKDSPYNAGWNDAIRHVLMDLKTGAYSNHDPSPSQEGLLPCPFCGGDVEFTEHPMSGEHEIECGTCPFISFWPVDWASEQVQTAWNTRHTLPHTDWVAMAYAKLGAVRDKMAPADVLAVQNFLGPLPGGQESP